MIEYILNSVPLLILKEILLTNHGYKIREDTSKKEKVFSLILNYYLGRKFMSITALKLVALITMWIDHIGFFIPNTPIWFRYIGRLSAPIFLFCAVQGFIYTGNKKRYMFRIYLFSVFMGMINALLVKKTYVAMNYIRTIFITILIIFLIDCFKNHNPSTKKYTITFILWEFAVGSFLMFYSDSICDEIACIIFPLLIAPIFLEYGFLFVLLGICMYLFTDSKKKLSISYILITLSIMFFQNTDFLSRVIRKIHRFGIQTGYELLKNISEILDLLIQEFLDIEVRFLKNDLWYTAQWLMILSLPFLLVYNGQKGKGLKYLFYIMYPFNIIILYYIRDSMILS